MKKLLFIGLGRIGLPQSLIFANEGFTIFGFDTDTSVIEDIKKSVTPFYEPKMDEYLSNNINKTFFPLSSWEEVNKQLSDIDAIFFTVGTPGIGPEEALSKTGVELTGHYKILDNLFSKNNELKKGVAIIFRTTFPVGTTRQLKQYIESTHGAKEGKDFFLAFVPERIRVGYAIHEEETLPKIVGTYSDMGFNKVSELFQKIGGKIIRVDNPRTAEFCKLTDNSFRSTLFSYANDLAMHASEQDINVTQVIHTVNDQYTRNHIPMPGFVSGYCLNKDPYLFELTFSKDEEERDFQSLWYYGRRINDYLIRYTVKKVLHHLKKHGDGCVTILGLSFKGNKDDFRMSHTFDIMRMLIADDIKKFKIYDPFLNNSKYTTVPKDILPFIIAESTTLDSTLVEDASAVIIGSMHQSLIELSTENLSAFFDKTKQPCYLFDAYNIWGNAEAVSHIDYEGLGHPLKKAQGEE